QNAKSFIRQHSLTECISALGSFGKFWEIPVANSLVEGVRDPLFPSGVIPLPSLLSRRVAPKVGGKSAVAHRADPTAAARENPRKNPPSISAVAGNERKT
ncbi:MAG TPA: hypothetical protein VL282_14770, partial [Tepidisphaeraceae bacterium]|nr:hypothetical protein [Tepidisphaeraceae bacterium]